MFTKATPLDTLEQAARDHLAECLDARTWGEKCNPQTILQLCAQLRIYQKHDQRETNTLF